MLGRATGWADWTYPATISRCSDEIVGGENGPVDGDAIWPGVIGMSYACILKMGRGLVALDFSELLQGERFRQDSRRAKTFHTPY